MFSVLREDVNSRERLKFAEAITNKSKIGLFLKFLDTEKGKTIFNSFVKNKCISSVSGILSLLTGNAAEVLRS